MFVIAATMMTCWLVEYPAPRCWTLDCYAARACWCRWQVSVGVHAVPMFHIADCASLFAITLIGGSHAFLPSFSPEGSHAWSGAKKAS